MVAADICFASVVDSRKVDVFETVKKIRSQRDSSVQKVEQYNLINLAVCEFIISFDKDLCIQLQPVGPENNYEAAKATVMAECVKANDADVNGV